LYGGEFAFPPGGCGCGFGWDVAVEVNAAQGANTAASGNSQALSIGLRRQCV